MQGASDLINVGIEQEEKNQASSRARTFACRKEEMNHGEKESARAHGWRELVNVGIGFRIIDTEEAQCAHLQ